MVMTFSGNPFADITPGGSPSEPFSRPRRVALGDREFLVLMLWDWDLMASRNTPEQMGRFYDEGITAQAKLREPGDGTEYFARVIYGESTELRMTGFRGPAAAPTSTQQQQPTTEKEEDEMPKTTKPAPVSKTPAAKTVTTKKPAPRAEKEAATSAEYPWLLQRLKKGLVDQYAEEADRRSMRDALRDATSYGEVVAATGWEPEAVQEFLNAFFSVTTTRKEKE